MSTLTGRKIRKYSGSTRPEGIDPYMWSHFASAKERKEAKELYEAELKAKEQDFGFRWNPHSWLSDTNLIVQPMRLLAFDWMHCWCETGVWDVKLGACKQWLSTRHATT